MGLIGCPVTSVRNYQSTLPNILEERIYQYLKCLLQGEIGTELRVKTEDAKRNEDYQIIKRFLHSSRQNLLRSLN
jgi:hypothetical protein